MNFGRGSAIIHNSGAGVDGRVTACYSSNMAQELATIPEENNGPYMSALTELQRAFVRAYIEHPNYTGTQLAELAGYASSSKGSLQVTGSRLLRDPKVIAACNEEAGKRLQTGGLIGISGIIALALNSAHKDHLKACIALADRTGFHALSEHKVTVDDKRPQTKQELLDAVHLMGKQAGLTDSEITKLTGEAIVDAEFTVVAEPALDAETEADIARQMEDF